VPALGRQDDEPASRRGVVLAWSGGKDSALSLWALRERGVAVGALLTTITEGTGRVSMHGVRRELVVGQAAAAGLPLVEMAVPRWPSNAVYERRLAGALAAEPLGSMDELAFGDLHLEDIRAYREDRLAGIGKRARFPLWGRPTAQLARDFIAAGFEATLVCVDPTRLDGSFAGRRFDASLLADLPGDVDPCGEGGEFHTFVHDGPVFDRPLAVRPGSMVAQDGFVFCELLAG
jgi:uncharacterized protein (TIGR00290 family)